MSGLPLRHRWIVLLVTATLTAACGSGSGGADGGGDDDDDDDDVVRDGGPDAEVGPIETIHLIGRFDTSDVDGPRFGWPGTTIASRFSGTEIAISLDDTGANQFSVWIDGEEQAVLSPKGGAGTFTLASGLPDGEHDVRVSRRTESFFGPTQFLGFPGAILVDTAGQGRMIELVGDSITCGYGVLGEKATCGFSADTESELDAWGGLTAAALDAGHVAIAYSGKGVYRDREGSTVDQMPALFERIFADDPESAWDFAYTPDVVVINLGTNDFAEGDPGVPFRDAYGTFIAAVRARYPEAWIIAATSPMLSDGFPQGEMQRTVARAHLEAIVAAAADARVVFLDLEEQVFEELGCDYHPGTLTAQSMAAALTAEIRARTGW
jgi:lysophospholipase L1-like esterase